MAITDFCRLCDWPTAPFGRSPKPSDQRSDRLPVLSGRYCPLRERRSRERTEEPPTERLKGATEVG
ncbi:hypothetical protein [Haladaptatus sp. CMAA 1911]|uniref:hypothetical protein n=1 Tax=Haladaptatus sp. CMAA 1911 TaxID=3368987 RepID=UPI0037542B22